MLRRKIIAGLLCALGVGSAVAMVVTVNYNIENKINSIQREQIETVISETLPSTEYLAEKDNTYTTFTREDVEKIIYETLDTTVTAPNVSADDFNLLTNTITKDVMAQLDYDFKSSAPTESAVDYDTLYDKLYKNLSNYLTAHNSLEDSTILNTDDIKKLINESISKFITKDDLSLVVNDIVEDYLSNKASEFMKNSVLNDDDFMASLKEEIGPIESNELSLVQTDDGYVITCNSTKATLYHGRDGKDGAQGVAGKDGANGKDGADGKDGLNGKDGADGLPGKDGKDGSDGKDGLPGKDGTNGRDGVDGKDGAPGKNGIDGKDGKDGLDGAPGKDGLDGAPGKDGINGQDGKDGVDGAPGKDGLNGQDGKDGIDGQDGKDGVDGKGITLVEEVASNSEYTQFRITYGNNDSTVLFNLANGKDGVDGKDGKDGVDGAKGEKGDKGEDGRDGVDGVDGEDGRDGEDGEDGYTPVFGVDYYTPEQVNIVSDTVANRVTLTMSPLFGAEVYDSSIGYSKGTVVIYENTLYKAVSDTTPGAFDLAVWAPYDFEDRYQDVNVCLGYAEYNPYITYEEGAIVLYNGELYKCIENITIAESWNPAKWEKTSLNAAVENLNAANVALSDKLDEYAEATSQTQTTLVNDVARLYGEQQNTAADLAALMTLVGNNKDSLSSVNASISDMNTILEQHADTLTAVGLNTTAISDLQELIENNYLTKLEVQELVESHVPTIDLSNHYTKDEVNALVEEAVGSVPTTTIIQNVDLRNVDVLLDATSQPLAGGTHTLAKPITDYAMVMVVIGCTDKVHVNRTEFQPNIIPAELYFKESPDPVGTFVAGGPNYLMWFGFDETNPSIINTRNQSIFGLAAVYGIRTTDLPSADLSDVYSKAEIDALLEEMKSEQSIGSTTTTNIVQNVDLRNVDVLFDATSQPVGTGTYELNKPITDYAMLIVSGGTPTDVSSGKLELQPMLVPAEMYFKQSQDPVGSFCLGVTNHLFWFGFDETNPSIINTRSQGVVGLSAVYGVRTQNVSKVAVGTIYEDIPNNNSKDRTNLIYTSNGVHVKRYSATPSREAEHNYWVLNNTHNSSYTSTMLLETDQALDLTKYSKLVLDFETMNLGQGTSVVACINTNPISDSADTITSTSYFYLDLESKKRYEIDLPDNANQPYYLAFGIAERTEKSGQNNYRPGAVETDTTATLKAANLIRKDGKSESLLNTFDRFTEESYTGGGYELTSDGDAHMSIKDTNLNSGQLYSRTSKVRLNFDYIDSITIDVKDFTSSKDGAFFVATTDDMCNGDSLRRTSDLFNRYLYTTKEDLHNSTIEIDTSGLLGYKYLYVGVECVQCTCAENHTSPCDKATGTADAIVRGVYLDYRNTPKVSSNNKAPTAVVVPGQTSEPVIVDLSSYLTKDEMSELIAELKEEIQGDMQGNTPTVDLSAYYSKEEIDELVANLSAINDYSISTVNLNNTDVIFNSSDTPAKTGTYTLSQPITNYDMIMVVTDVGDSEFKTTLIPKDLYFNTNTWTEESKVEWFFNADAPNEINVVAEDNSGVVLVYGLDTDTSGSILIETGTKNTPVVNSRGRLNMIKDPLFRNPNASTGQSGAGGYSKTNSLGYHEFKGAFNDGPCNIGWVTGTNTAVSMTDYEKIVLDFEELDLGDIGCVFAAHDAPGNVQNHNIKAWQLDWISTEESLHYEIPVAQISGDKYSIAFGVANRRSASSSTVREEASVPGTITSVLKSAYVVKKDGTVHTLYMGNSQMATSATGNATTTTDSEGVVSLTAIGNTGGMTRAHLATSKLLNFNTIKEVTVDIAEFKSENPCGELAIVLSKKVNNKDLNIGYANCDAAYLWKFRGDELLNTSITIDTSSVTDSYYLHIITSSYLTEDGTVNVASPGAVSAKIRGVYITNCADKTEGVYDGTPLPDGTITVPTAQIDFGSYYTKLEIDELLKNANLGGNSQTSNSNGQAVCEVIFDSGSTPISSVESKEMTASVNAYDYIIVAGYDANGKWVSTTLPKDILTGTEEFSLGAVDFILDDTTLSVTSSTGGSISKVYGITNQAFRMSKVNNTTLTSKGSIEIGDISNSSELVVVGKVTYDNTVSEFSGKEAKFAINVPTQEILDGSLFSESVYVDDNVGAHMTFFYGDNNLNFAGCNMEGLTSIEILSVYTSNGISGTSNPYTIQTLSESDVTDMLQDYYSKSEVDTMLQDIDLSEYIKTVSVDAKLLNYYNKSITDTKIADVADSMNSGLGQAHLVLEDTLNKGSFAQLNCNLNAVSYVIVGYNNTNNKGDKYENIMLSSDYTKPYTFDCYDNSTITVTLDTDNTIEVTDATGDVLPWVTSVYVVYKDGSTENAKELCNVSSDTSWVVNDDIFKYDQLTFFVRYGHQCWSVDIDPDQLAIDGRQVFIDYYDGHYTSISYDKSTRTFSNISGNLAIIIDSIVGINYNEEETESVQNIVTMTQEEFDANPPVSGIVGILENGNIVRWYDCAELNSN